MTANAKFVHLFLEELRPSVLVEHPNIATVLDIAKTPAHTYYIVTEYVDGCTLETLVVRRQRIAIEHALRVMIDCCKGLEHAHAHEHAIVHRDVSPHTILLSNKGAVKVTDFGYARIATQLESSEPVSVKGKFSYLSPEAASGLEVDLRADVFAAGIVLWELLAGRRLFLGDTDYQTVELVRSAHVPPIDRLAPALDRIVRKALARDRDARHQRANELADALVEYAFAHGLALAPSSIAPLVRQVQLEIAPAPIDAELFARVQEDVSRMTSVVHDETPRRWN